MAYNPLDYVEPNVCVDENIITDESGMIVLQPWSVPRLVVDTVAASPGNGKLFPTPTLPGRLLIDHRTQWRNNSPVDMMVLIRVTRWGRSWVVSNPNAIQIRDRWTTLIDEAATAPTLPITTGIYNSQTGSAIDVGTNSVAEPLPGVQYFWSEANSADEWVGPVKPQEWLNLWYRCYVWTPPPFSDNANKNSPIHYVNGGRTRIQMMAFSAQGDLVTG